MLEKDVVVSFRDVIDDEGSGGAAGIDCFLTGLRGSDAGCGREGYFGDCCQDASFDIFMKGGILHFSIERDSQKFAAWEVPPFNNRVNIHVVVERGGAVDLGPWHDCICVLFEGVMVVRETGWSIIRVDTSSEYVEDGGGVCCWEGFSSGEGLVVLLGGGGVARGEHVSRRLIRGRGCILGGHTCSGEECE